MKLAAPLLHFPYLHKEISFLEPSSVARALSCIPALSLWVGIPLHTSEPQDTTWRPENYPFSPKEAEACLRDIANMGDMALSGMPIEALVAAQPARDLARDVKEQEALQAFVESASMESATAENTNKNATRSAEPHTQTLDVHSLRAAQRFLLMAWYVEKRFLEVRALTKDYAHGTRSLQKSLGATHNNDTDDEHEDAYDSGGDTDRDADDGVLKQLAQMNATLYDVDVPLPDWRKVLENAAIFLPQTCTLLINDSTMAQHIREHCTVEPLSADTLTASCKPPTPLPQDIAFSQHSCTVGSLLHAGLPNNTQLASSPYPWHTKIIHCILVEKF